MYKAVLKEALQKKRNPIGSAPDGAMAGDYLPDRADCQRVLDREMRNEK